MVAATRGERLGKRRLYRLPQRGPGEPGPYKGAEEAAQAKAYATGAFGASMARGAWTPAALPANGNRAMLRARLMATPSQRWCRAQTPVMRRGRILPRSCTNWERMSARL